MSTAPAEGRASANAAGREYLRVVVIAAAIGVPAALVAAIFLGAVHILEEWLWTDLPGQLGYSRLPWFMILGLPTAGALLVIVARRLLPGDGGKEPLLGMTAEAPTPLSYVPGITLAALGTLAFGAVLGPEMPVIALGSAVGVAAQRFVKLNAIESRVLSSAGSFSAISALFGGPLVAGMLLVESGVGAGAALIPALLPGLVAAATGYLVFVGFGHWTGLPTPGLVVPDLPPYTGDQGLDLTVALLVGISTVILLVGVRRLAELVELQRTRIGMPALLVLGGLGVGLLALVGEQLGANPQDVLFSGQSSLSVVVEAPSLALIAVLLLTKSLAYSISLGSGFRGGPIFPALFIGIAVASIAVVGLGVSPTLAVSIGAAAGMAAQTRLLFAPLLLATLLVGTNGIDTISAAVLAAVSAWLTVRFLDRFLAPPASDPSADSASAS